MNNIILTGGAGFFGFNLVRRLIEKGYRLTVVVRPDSEHNQRLFELNSERLDIVEVDIEEIDRLPEKLSERLSQRLSGNLPERLYERPSGTQSALSQSGTPYYDTFYHLAWQGGRNDIKAQFRNVSDSLKALEAAKALGCRRFICSGSQAEYGAASEMITEQAPLAPFSAYGAAKASACYLTKVRAEQIGIEWVWGRIFSLIGSFEPKGRMLPDLIEKLKKGEKPELSSCTQYWDYLDAADAADAFIALGESGIPGEAYNIANGNYRVLKDYTEIVRERFSPGADISYGEPPSPFVSLKPSVEKIKRDTGWEPVTSFEESLDKY